MWQGQPQSRRCTSSSGSNGRFDAKHYALEFEVEVPGPAPRTSPMWPGCVGARCPTVVRRCWSLDARLICATRFVRLVVLRARTTMWTGSGSGSTAPRSLGGTPSSWVSAACHAQGGRRAGQRAACNRRQAAKQRPPLARGWAVRDVAHSVRDDACRKHAARATTRSVQRSACCVRDRPAPPLFPLPNMRNVVSCLMAWDTARRHFFPSGCRCAPEQVQPRLQAVHS